MYNTTSFGALIQGMKNVKIDEIPLRGLSNTTSIKLGDTKPFKIETEKWIENELALINSVIEFLSKNTFSPALISAIVNSSMMYLYMQANVLEVMQSKMDDSLAEGFIEKTKTGIKEIVDQLQRNKLI